MSIRFPQPSHDCQMSLGLRAVGDRVTLENKCIFFVWLVPGKRDDHPLRLLIFLLQEDYDKAETEASKGRGMWALMWSCGASLVGKDSGSTALSTFFSFGP